MSEAYIITNQKYFPAEKMVLLREKLKLIDERRFNLLISVQLKDPSVVLLSSFILGFLGVDRFMVRNTGMGILKLLTFGLCSILTVVDWFLIAKITREYNYKAVTEIL